MKQGKNEREVRETGNNEREVHETGNNERVDVVDDHLSMSSDDVNAQSAVNENDSTSHIFDKLNDLTNNILDLKEKLSEMNGSPHPTCNEDKIQMQNTQQDKTDVIDIGNKELQNQISDYRLSQKVKFDKEKSMVDVLIIGNSMTRHINPKQLSSARKICCKTTSGLRVEDTYDIARKTLGELNANELILHVGTNNIATNDPVDLATRIESIGLQISASCPSLRKISISSIVPRGTGSSHDSNVKIFNGHLRSLHTKHK